MNTPRTTSRMTRIITQSSLVVILAVLVGFAFATPRADWFWFFSAIFFLMGLLFTFSGLFFDSPFAEAIGLRNARVVRPRGFYITFGLICMALAVGALVFHLFNHSL